MSTESDEQLRIWTERISESNRGAFESLFRSLYPRLVRFAYGYVKNRPAAADIVQDAFVALWEKRQNLDPGRSVRAYLYRTVRNRSLNYIRDHANETVGMDPISQRTDMLKKDDTNTSDPRETDMLMSLLKDWIKELPERQREAFELSRFEGLDHDEIAGVMNVSPNTVNNHIVSALDYLRNRFDTYEKEIDRT